MNRPLLTLMVTIWILAVLLGHAQWRVSEIREQLAQCEATK